MEKIYLGKTREDFNLLSSEEIFLSKHSWDCNWYWGFGYIGNKNLHTHFDSTFLKETNIDKIFYDTNITQDDYWIIRDLFIQAYSLKKTAEIYKYGGHQTTKKGITDIIQNENLVKKLNTDLKKVLDLLWNFLIEATKDKKQRKTDCIDIVLNLVKIDLEKNYKGQFKETNSDFFKKFEFLFDYYWEKEIFNKKLYHCKRIDYPSNLKNCIKFFDSIKEA